MSEIREVPRWVLPESITCPRHEMEVGVERGWIVTDRRRRNEYVTLSCGCTLRSDKGIPVAL